MLKGVNRCRWCGSDPLYIQYHDSEWGVPLHHDRKLFEFLVLESFQAGLSWLTILRKRAAFKAAFCGFSVKKVARFNASKIERLVSDKSIIRNRAKVLAAITNARCFLEVKAEHGSFDRYIWQFVNGNPIINNWESEALIPSITPESEAMSRDMRSKGFKFIGPTICYAFMQAIGMVNDHITACFRHDQLRQLDEVCKLGLVPTSAI
jgi:DNA-3-methyladenine glycosylase I